MKTTVSMAELMSVIAALCAIGGEEYINKVMEDFKSVNPNNMAKCNIILRMLKFASLRTDEPDMLTEMVANVVENHTADALYIGAFMASRVNSVEMMEEVDAFAERESSATYVEMCNSTKLFYDLGELWKTFETNDKGFKVCMKPSFD